MPVIPIAALAISAGATAYGAIESNKAARNAADVDNATAAYNAKLDQAQAEQIDLDAQQNIRLERQDAKVYLSRQAASYAAAGVLGSTGSALAAQITNSGRFEQKAQQDWVNAQQKEATLYSQAKVGIAEGAAQADADRMRGSIALIDGGAKIAGEIYQGYESGAFSFGKS